MLTFRSAIVGIFLCASTAASAQSIPGSIRIAPGLSEPLVAARSTTDVEDRDLRLALDRFRVRPDSSDVSALTGYLTAHPDSGWSAALWANLGYSYLHDGYFSKSLDAWSSAWKEGRDASSPEARALADRAIGELANLNANFGRMDELGRLFDGLGDRKVSGPATETIQTARETLMMVKAGTGHLFNCGPLALRALMVSEGVKPEALNLLQYYNPGPDGTSLEELAQLADKLKFSYRLVSRSPGQAVPIPSVVHWKVGHFAAITGERDGRYHVRDAVFPNSDLWVTKAALDSEASGSYLVPWSQSPPTSWSDLSSEKAALVRGKGQTNQTRAGDAGDELANKDPQKPTPNFPSVTPANPDPSCPLCVVGIKESSVSINLTDTPVGYVPPLGPSMKVRISYNQREDSQPANFDYFNIGQKWSLSWSSYVIDDPTMPGANVSRVMGEGGAFYYIGYDPARRTFAAQDTDGSVLSLASQSPVQYRRQLRDGSLELYEQSNGSTAFPRKVFLTKVVDPHGNAASLHYDGQSRLLSITDAVGRETTFSYAVSGRPLLVSAITDPFGRSAKLTYDDLGRLASITDIIGLTSAFTYDANSLIDSLTTPYGVSRFKYTAPGTAAPPRFAQVTDPLGNKEREEWLEPAPIPNSEPTATVPVGMPMPLMNNYLVFRNSFHWDKSAYIAAGCADNGGCDYTKARLRHFVHMPNSTIKGTAVESEKYPLENRVWYTYPGQTEANYGGTYDKPTAVGRVLDDGSSQISRYAYDTSGNLVQETDPAGRSTFYAYTDGINLASISQASEFGTRSTLAQYVYNKQRRPTLYVNAAGRPTSLEYNQTGQLTSSTNALGQKTAYQYDANANLASITNANNATAASYTYDPFARVRTSTDSEGWTVTYDYDAADRLTKVTYLDGTKATYTYDRLDLSSYKDREGRLWKYQYDANRRLTGVIDPLGQSVGLSYDPSGNLVGLTDPKGNNTLWSYDIQDRLTSKTYADNTAVAYTYENATSRLKSALDALGQTKQYGYTIDDNLTGITYLNAVNPTPNVAFGYDPYFNRISFMTDGTGRTDYTYYPSYDDGAQQLQQECFTATGATGCSHSISYNYDELGRLGTRQISGSGPETFAYDDIGRVTGHTSDLGAFQLSYLGQTPQLTVRQLLPMTSNLKTTWSYLDNVHDRRLAGIANTGLVAGEFTNFTFQTSPENFITGITQSSDATVAEPDPAAQKVTFNSVNEIGDVSGQSYSYDANGNMLSDGERTYEWDAENRLLAVSRVSSARGMQFTYDGFGRRVKTNDITQPDQNIVAKITWCGNDLCQSIDENSSAVSTYLPEGEFHSGNPAASIYYGVDQLGSVRRTFDGITASVQDFDPWGVPLVSQAEISDLTYAGMFQTGDIDVDLSWFRPYSAQNGRWLSRDPLSRGLNSLSTQNSYEYVLSNPLAKTDPYGLAPLDPNGTVPGGPWTPAGPGQRPGSFFGPAQPGGRDICTWVPPEAEGGPPGSQGYWKAKGPNTPWERYNQRGGGISPEEAHPGNPGGGAPFPFVRYATPAGAFLGTFLYSSPAY